MSPDRKEALTSAPEPGPDDSATGAARVSRRAALKVIGLLPLVPAIGSVPGAGVLSAEELSAATPATGAEAAAGSARLRFFTAHEYATVRMLADMVIPADAQSGSASEAGVPEYVDFVLSDGGESGRVAFRGGLSWLDAESRRRYGVAFVRATRPQRAALLDDIAWPTKAKPAMRPGVLFFNGFRDLTAAGFFSSEMGHRDLNFQGNVPVGEWKGCGAAAEAHALRSPPGAATRPATGG